MFAWLWGSIIKGYRIPFLAMIAFYIEVGSLGRPYKTQSLTVTESYNVVTREKAAGYDIFKADIF